MSARDALLERIRGAARGVVAHPGAWQGRAGDARPEAFAAALRAAGGELHGPLARAELAGAVRRWAAAHGDGGRVVAEPGAADLLGAQGFEVVTPGPDPHAFADVGVAVVRGTLGVAEDGAVAVCGRDAPDRALLFLAQRLVLLLEAERLVPDLHAGFRALPADALAHHHLTWISGPSKTADIEQTLVLGAHGPRELAVFLVGPARAPD